MEYKEHTTYSSNRFIPPPAYSTIRTTLPCVFLTVPSHTWYKHLTLFRLDLCLKLPVSNLFGSALINLLTFNITKPISTWRWCTLQNLYFMNTELSFNWQHMPMLSHFSIQHWDKVKWNYFKSKGSSSNNIAQTGRPKPSKQNDKAYTSTKMQPQLNSTQTAIDSRDSN